MKHLGAHQTTLFFVFLVLITFSITTTSCKNNDHISPDKGYYTCSMHPQVIKQEPGDCPICHMKLTKVILNKTKHNKTTEKNSTNTTLKHNHFKFSVAGSLLNNSNVYTVAAKNENFSKESTYSGHVDYNEDPNRLVIINTKYSGWIEQLYVSKEGQWIKRGQLLMAAYSPQILAAKEEYLTTYKAIKELFSAQGKPSDAFIKDRSILAAKQKLLNLDVPYYQITKIEKQLQVDRLTYFSSPISGVIIKKNVLQGSHITPGMELFRIADLGVLWIYIHIFEKDIPFVKKGQMVTLQTEAYPGKTFKGIVDLIYPFFQKKTRDVRVQIIVPNYQYLLKPGMFVQVDVKSAFSGKVVTVPEVSVMYSGKNNYVFVSLGEGNFEVRPVIVLARSNGKAVISHGLKVNELVVANGQFLLDSEASLKEALQKGSLKGSLTGHQH